MIDQLVTRMCRAVSDCTKITKQLNAGEEMDCCLM